MPPKFKITKQQIIDTALDIARREGAQAINARNIAKVLGCSTQPVFSNFESMEILRCAVAQRAQGLCEEYLKKEIESGEYPVYKANGMAYIRFAKEEKEVFKLLFMRDRTGEKMSLSPDFEESVKIIMGQTAMSYEKATLMHFEMWSFVHGIATMIATSFLELDWNIINNMTSDVYQGIKAKHMSEVGE